MITDRSRARVVPVIRARRRRNSGASAQPAASRDRWPCGVAQSKWTWVRRSRRRSVHRHRTSPIPPPPTTFPPVACKWVTNNNRPELVGPRFHRSTYPIPTQPPAFGAVRLRLPVGQRRATPASRSARAAHEMREARIETIPDHPVPVDGRATAALVARVRLRRRRLVRRGSRMTCAISSGRCRCGRPARPGGSTQPELTPPP
jgi:hypothetical protein